MELGCETKQMLIHPNPIDFTLDGPHFCPFWVPQKEMWEMWMVKSYLPSPEVVHAVMPSRILYDYVGIEIHFVEVSRFGSH